jgi:uncharacterized phiE125 gp8 family phage protein
MFVTALSPVDGDTLLPLAEARQHLRLDAVDPEVPTDPEVELENTEIRAFRDAAIDWIETYTGRALQRRAFRWTGAGFKRAGTLPMRPVRLVTGVAYLAKGGVVALDQADYRIAGDGIVAAVADRWPVTQEIADAVRVEFEAGYDDEMPCPPALLVAIKMLLAHFYRNRGATTAGVTVAEVPFGAVALCGPYRAWAIV